MTTQYTPTLKLALPVTGELSGTWGDVVNDNITSMVEQAIAGLSTINTWTANAHILTTANGTTSESRCAMLVAATGTGGTALTAAGEIICPAAAKLYVLQNTTAFAITLKTSAGTGVAVAAGNTSFLFCDGTNVNACVTTIVDGNVTGNLTVGGNATINGNTTLGNATSDTITATARFNTDLLPSTDNARDLGSSANSWKDLYIDGTAYLALVDINGGTIDGVSIGATTAATLINVDNLRLDGNTLSSTDTNGNIIVAPNGTGDVQLDADTVRIGDAGAAVSLTSNGAGALTVTTGGAADITLSTNSGTTSGTITIANGANGNITLTPDGTGDVILSSDRTQIGDLNTDTTLTTNGTGSLNLSTNNGTNSGTIQIAQGVNGNITLTPNGTGLVSIPSAVISGGTANGVAFLDASKVLTTGSVLTFDGTNLGVGIASAATRLHAVGDNVASRGQASLQTSTANNFAQLTFYDRTTLGAQIYQGYQATAGVGDLTIQTVLTSSALVFGTNSTERARISSDGTFRVKGVGTAGSTDAFQVAGTAPADSMVLNSSGNLGVGTASPAVKLHVLGSSGSGAVQIGSSAGANQYQYITFGGSIGGTDFGWQVGRSSNTAGLGGDGAFYFYDIKANATRMSIDSAGNLGLGVTPSNFAVVKAFQAEYATLAGNSSVNLAVNAYFNSGWKYTAAASALLYTADSGSHKWYVSTSAQVINTDPVFSQAMTLDASGNLLVGTTTQIGRLTIENSATTVEVALRSTGGAGINTRSRIIGGFEAGGSDFGGFLAFNTTTTQNVNTERARISSDGTFRVKGAGTAGSTDAFQVAGTAPADAARIDSSGNLLVGTATVIQGGTVCSFFDGQTRNGIILQTSFTSGGTSFIRFVNSAGTAQGEISANSTTTVTYGTSSDYRLKTVIGPVADAGQRIDALQPVEYTWNSNGERTRGFLAHQFQEVYAGSVNGTKDAVDAEGKPVYQSMQASTSEVIADLVAELQSLRARVAALEAA